MQKSNEQHDNRRHSRITAVVLFALALCVGTVVVKQLRRDTPTLDLNNLPAEGFAYNDTKGKVPGDPENGINDLNRLYDLIQTYRRRNGKSPESSFDIAKDVPNAPEQYGFRTAIEAMVFLTNPDSQYGDRTKDRGTGIVPYAMVSRRPDGTPSGSAKRSGERDVVAYTDLYVHENIRLFKGERSTTNPVGNYLVLWDDGQVDKVPYDKILLVDDGKGNYKPGFTGQAGLPTTGVLTYEQFYNKFGRVVKRE